MKFFRFNLFLILISFLHLSCSSGDGKNVQVNGLQGPYVEKNDRQLLISVVLENVFTDGGLRYPLHEIKDSYIEIAPHQSSKGTLFAASLNIDEILNGDVKELPEMSLPGGRALPGVSRGKLPASAFTIDRFPNTVIYVGSEVFGIFVPVKGLNVGQGILTFRYYIKGHRAGNLSVVGHDANGENEGLLLMLDLNETVKQKLKDLGYL
ncbi:MAG: hypothetical protein H6622_12015 [Halobacteriovoraceae bacterium]|nr:hypothetical protein [Halobacteriovoraceae bacterium]